MVILILGRKRTDLSLMSVQVLMVIPFLPILHEIRRHVVYFLEYKLNTIIF